MGGRECGLEPVVSTMPGIKHPWEILTEHVARPAIFAEELLVLQGPPEADEKLRPAFDTGHLVPGSRLQALGEFLHC